MSNKLLDVLSAIIYAICSTVYMSAGLLADANVI